MRSSGVPEWPDPDRNGGFDKSKLRQLGYTKAQTTAAEQRCVQLLPAQQTVQQTQTRRANMLSFARCVRERGFPAFPDPTQQGQLTPEIIAAAGTDLRQPKLMSAGLACVSLTHGLLTPAAIERAVNGASPRG
jgi:hypothetical protein